VSGTGTAATKRAARAERPLVAVPPTVDAKASDIRITPAWLLDLVRAFAGGEIALDVCTEPSNPARAQAFYALPTSGLDEDWTGALRAAERRSTRALISVAWANVPYSREQVQRWAEKAVREARAGAEILFLTKDDCRTGWNLFLRENADARCRIAKGIGFLEPDGEGGYRKLPGPRWGECLWYFGRHRRRFERVFSAPLAGRKGPLGEVTHLLGPQEEL
jgi:hypothetical protein